ncbi:DUF664 domain-containing protein [Pseudactinotalea terrae]|uniref:mycothiol transferase n=1 Tax=Pseudactinotalea terrae TaxID=1743262 RepID=UPI0012E27049|nr:DUF664 domain-containing protein [Pseudactinotalea terrae]
MTETPPPWEPPFNGSEIEHLLGALERQRATFRWKADGLDERALARTVGASALTLGGLLKHLACVEDEKWGQALSGAPYGPPWAGMVAYPGDPKTYTFDTTGLTAAELYAMWDESVARARTRITDAISQGGPDQQVAMGADDGFVVSLRRLLCDIIEEYGRHTGHADLLREAIDGRVGEDPPPNWRLPG